MTELDVIDRAIDKPQYVGPAPDELADRDWTAVNRSATRPGPATWVASLLRQQPSATDSSSPPSRPATTRAGQAATVQVPRHRCDPEPVHDVGIEELGQGNLDSGAIANIAYFDQSTTCKAGLPGSVRYVTNPNSYYEYVSVGFFRFTMGSTNFYACEA